MKGWGAKKLSSVCPSKPRDAKLFGGISRDFASKLLDLLLRLYSCDLEASLRARPPGLTFRSFALKERGVRVLRPTNLET